MIIEKAGKIVEGLYALADIDLPAWLVTAETPVLFDAGITFMGPAYFKEIQQVLGDENRLRWLFITHAHFDHSGTGPYLKRRIPGLKVAASRLAAEIFKKPNAVNLIQSLSRDFEEQYKSHFGSEDIRFDSLEVDRILEDGETVDLGRRLDVQGDRHTGSHPRRRFVLLPEPQGPHLRLRPPASVPTGISKFIRSFSPATGSTWLPWKSWPPWRWRSSC